MKYIKVEKIESVEELEHILGQDGIPLYKDDDCIEDIFEAWVEYIDEGLLYTLTDEYVYLDGLYEPKADCEVYFNSVNLIQTITCTLYMYKDDLYAEAILFEVELFRDSSSSHTIRKTGEAKMKQTLLDRITLSKDQNHPERQYDEVFLTNVSESTFNESIQFNTIGWNTKRLGCIAYDIHGMRSPGQRPVFVKKQEIIDYDAPKESH